MVQLGEVRRIDARSANDCVVVNHYLHRKCNVKQAFGLWIGDFLCGVVVFGTPGSRHLQISACPTNPSLVLELNRLWVHDACQRNSESYLVRSAIKQLPPCIIVSYADTSVGHDGTIYRAAGFEYAGWTDMDRKTPRFDYVVPGKHSRDAFRGGTMRSDVIRVRRKPKYKYWTVAGDRREKRDLRRICAWPSLPWTPVQ